MAKSKKKKTKHVPLSVLKRRYNRLVGKGKGSVSALGALIERRRKHPTDPNDRK